MLVLYVRIRIWICLHVIITSKNVFLTKIPLITGNVGSEYVCVCVCVWNNYGITSNLIKAQFSHICNNGIVN